MTRQTNIGLLLALIFIVAFSLVLTEFRQPTQDIDSQSVAKVDETYYQQATGPRLTPERPVVRREVRRRVAPVAPIAIRAAATTPREVAAAAQQPAPAPAPRIVTPVAPSQRRPDLAGTIRLPQDNTTPAYHERTLDQFAQDVQQMPAPAPRVYTVIRGDNLRKISKKIYNSDNKWRKIFNANRSKLRNPNDIKIGMTLVIPEA